MNNFKNNKQAKILVTVIILLMLMSTLSFVAADKQPEEEAEAAIEENVETEEVAEEPEKEEPEVSIEENAETEEATEEPEKEEPESKAILELPNNNEKTAYVSNSEELYYALQKIQDSEDILESIILEKNIDVSWFYTGSNRRPVVVRENQFPINLPAGKSFTLDLNGHSLSLNYPLMKKVEGSFTLKDSKAGNSSESIKDDSSLSKYGNKAEVSVDRNLENAAITYYVTKSTPTKVSTESSEYGKTIETVEKHSISSKGFLYFKGDRDIDDYPDRYHFRLGRATGAKSSINIESGIITSESSRNNAIIGADKKAVVNLKGGYIAGINSVLQNYGGAVTLRQATMNMTGTVIAGCSAYEGAAIYAGPLLERAKVKDDFQAQINVTGGIISGNTLHDSNGSGAAIYASNDIINLNGGYITNNVTKAPDSDNNTGMHGSAGIYLFNNTKLNINSGAQLTGNHAKTGGGGAIGTNDKSALECIYSSKEDIKPSVINLDGGIIASNGCEKHEGGGIAVYNPSRIIMKSGYVTNNFTNTKSDWGGGGVFAAEDGFISAKNILVTGNYSKGYGGGISSCSTGSSLFTSKNGVGIFDNKAEGKALTNGAKPYDREYIKEFKDYRNQVVDNTNKVFYEHDKELNFYPDFFGVNEASISGTMVGDVNPQWQGVYADYQGEDPHAPADQVSSGTKFLRKGTIAKDSNYMVNGLLALKSDPAKGAKIKARQSSEVFITGNRSTMHGGGIMINGNLAIGEMPNLDAKVDITPARLTINGFKELLDKDGKENKLNGHEFKFQIQEGDQEVSKAIQLNDGRIPFNSIELDKANEKYKYIVKEIGSYDDIIKDKTVYTVEVETKQGKTRKFSYVDDNGQVQDITEKQVLIKSINIKKNDKNIFSKDKINQTEYTVDDCVKFTNTCKKSNDNKKQKLTVKKVWEDDDNAREKRPDKVTLYVYKDGVTKPFDTITIDKKQWNQEIEVKLDKESTPDEYTVSEKHIKDYDPVITKETDNREKSRTDWKKATTFDDKKIFKIKDLNDLYLMDFGEEYYNTGWKKYAKSIEDNFLWEAIKAEGTKGFYLRNLETGCYLYLTNTDARVSREIDKPSRVENNPEYIFYYDTPKGIQNGDFLRTNSHYISLYNQKEDVACTNAVPSRMNATRIEMYETKTIIKHNVVNYTITNKLKEETVKITAKKKWDDKNDADGKRPTSINVNLKQIDSKGNVNTFGATIKDKDGWKYESEDWNRLPKYDKYGKLYNYELTEDKIDNYHLIENSSSIVKVKQELEERNVDSKGEYETYWKPIPNSEIKSRLKAEKKYYITGGDENGASPKMNGVFTYRGKKIAKYRFKDDQGKDYGIGIKKIDLQFDDGSNNYSFWELAKGEKDPNKNLIPISKKANLKNNGKNQYDLELSVTGKNEIKKDTADVNVLFIVDTTSSMLFNMKDKNYPEESKWKKVDYNKLEEGRYYDVSRKSVLGENGVTSPDDISKLKPQQTYNITMNQDGRVFYNGKTGKPEKMSGGYKYIGSKKFKWQYISREKKYRITTNPNLKLPLVESYYFYRDGKYYWTTDNLLNGKYENRNKEMGNKAKRYKLEDTEYKYLFSNYSSKAPYDDTIEPEVKYGKSSHDRRSVGRRRFNGIKNGYYDFGTGILIPTNKISQYRFESFDPAFKGTRWSKLEHSVNRFMETMDNNGENINARYQILGFNGEAGYSDYVGKPGTHKFKIDTLYSDAGIIQPWTSNSAEITNALTREKKNLNLYTTTNYEAPMWHLNHGISQGGKEYKPVLPKKMKKNEKNIVVFLTDGTPNTIYAKDASNYTDGQSFNLQLSYANGYYNDIVKNNPEYKGKGRSYWNHVWANEKAVNQAKNMKNVDDFYVVGLSNGISDRSGFKADELLENIAKAPESIDDKHKKFYNAQTSDALYRDMDEISKGIVYEQGVSNAHISDKLSNNVKPIDGAQLSIMVEDRKGNIIDSVKGDYKKVQTLKLEGMKESMTARYKDGTITLDFPDDYELDPMYDYKLGLEIEPTDKAKKDYSSGNYTDTADLNTGTYTGMNGIYSNAQASFIYMYGDEKKEDLFKEPVVRVAEIPEGNQEVRFTLCNSFDKNEKPEELKNLTVEKKWDDNKDSHSAVKIKLLQNGKVYDSCTLSQDNEWKKVWTGIPTSNRSGERYHYTVKEIEENEDYVSEVTGGDDCREINLQHREGVVKGTEDYYYVVNRPSVDYELPNVGNPFGTWLYTVLGSALLFLGVYQIRRRRSE